MNNKQQGFTLIELMIVVAIIGILASIAIPQFSAFRIKAFNTTAEADLKNFTTMVRALDTNGFFEPVSATSPNQISLTKGTQTETIKLSRGVTIIMLAATTASKRCMFSKHINGDTIMYSNTDNSSVFKYAPSPDAAGVALTDASTYAAAQTAACNI